MKYIFLIPFLFAGCLSYVGNPRCNKDVDEQRVERAVADMERIAVTVRVRYDKRKQIAVVSGYDIQRRFLRSEQVPQSCKL